MPRYPSRSSVNSTPAKSSIPNSATRPSTRSKPPVSAVAERSTPTSKATPKESHYFQKNAVQPAPSPSPAPSKISTSSLSSDDPEVSGYEDEDASAVSSPEPPSEDAQDDNDYDSDASLEPPRKKRKSLPKKSGSSTNVTPTSAHVAISEELWRQGVKTGLGPGKEVIIAKPKPRSAGKTPYADDQIHPNTMLFLSDLAKNNDREWLKMHDPDYRQSWNDFTSFLEGLQARLVGLDETIPELPTKDIVFRIYRDIRFSKDPTPYKTHFSAAWSRTGRKGPFAAYYIQIKPRGSFVGGGLWMPEARPLAALRRNIDRKPTKIKAVLKDAGIRKDFFGGTPADDKKVVKAFAAQNASNALKSKPKVNHRGKIPSISLTLPSYWRKMTDEEVIGPRGLDNIASKLRNLVPFVTYLNSIVMPDEPGDESTTADDNSDEE
ncbi:MAG: hypothetical protein M1828_002658 [Chrysothrix sp. TS-e1954]|nr:MAG: hypothetical protein M1828_002658 [Chrysothrix sp. TS-e1954]